MNAEPDKRRLSRDAWLAFGLKALGRQGPGAIRVDSLCRQLGVTKGSFYWHFENREAFLDAVLESWERAATDAIIERVEALEGKPHDRLRAIFDESRSGVVDFGAELAIRHWARRERSVADAVKRVDARRIAFMEDAFADGGFATQEATARAHLLYASILAEGLIFRREDAAAREARVEAVLDQVLGEFRETRTGRATA